MARSGTWSSANLLRLSSGLVTAAPVTLACWFRTTDNTSNQRLIGLFNSASASRLNHFSLQILGASTTLQALTGDATTDTGATSGTVNNNVWMHAAGVFASSTSRIAYLNGSAGSANTTSRTPSGINRTSIGLQDNAAASLPMKGDIAEAAIWNIALAQADITALAAGVPPYLVRPDALVAYWPLIGVNSPENNYKSNTNTMSIVGSLSQSSTAPIHPPILRAHRRLWMRKFPSLSNKTIAAAAGSYAFTGTTTSPHKGKVVAAAAGSYGFTGTAATPKHAWKPSAAAGSYAFNGTAATPKHAWRPTAGAGSYAFTGTAASPRRNLPLVPNSGSYAFTGTAATPKHAWRISAAAGSYAFTGTDATPTKTTPGAYSLIPDAGSYAFTGTAASLLHAWKTSAEAGSYAFTGTAASPLRARKTTAGAGSYAFSGTAATPKHAYVVTAGSGSYAFTGTSANLVLSSAGGNIFWGSTPVQNIYIGATPIVAVYRGTEQIF